MNSVPFGNTKRNRLLYIFQATFEYFVSILVTGSFLATLTKELGFSDSLTGVVTSIISLGCLFQLLSLCVRPKQEKRFITILSVLNQLLFMSLYVIPLTNYDRKTKIVLFVVLIFSAYILYNITHPKKISWFMSFVENKHRGRFTANKEIASLLSGMAFSFGMGCLVDYFSAKGSVRTSFVISAATIFVLMLLHSFAMISTSENPSPSRLATNFRGALPALIKDKTVFRVAIVFILYYISTYISTPFYGTYQINELGLNLKYISLIAMSESISRILTSRFWGKYADKKSFAAMIEKCFIFLGLSQLFVIFAVPLNGKIMFALYHLLHGVALGGINSALINLTFDCVPIEKRADSLALTQALAGLTGFLTTLCISPLVSFIQIRGNIIVLGFSVYAQQIVTIIGFAITLITIVYVRNVMIKNKTI